MVSPKPESYHDALYHLAAAAESSPSPQPSYYPLDSQHHPASHHHPHHLQHDPAQHHHSQSRHYMNMASAHRAPHPQNQYRYQDRSYSPASAAAPPPPPPPPPSSTSHHADASASRLPPPSAPSARDTSIRPSPAHASERSEDVNQPANGSSDAAASAAGEKKISCMECRLSKVKCSGGDLCVRCKRLGKECYYKSHKRGRKSDSSKIQKLERTVDSLSRALEQFSKNKVASSPGSLQSLTKSASVDSKRTARSQAPDNEQASSPDAYWKGAEPARPSAPSSSSAMSPPTQSPRGPPTSAYRDAASNVPRRPSEAFRQRSTSSSWQTPHSIASATPTSDDPDEPENLGLPTLSNPLKLLAHASDSARDRDSGLESSDPSSSADVGSRAPAKKAAASADPSEAADPAHPNTNGAAAAASSSADPSSSAAKDEMPDRNGRASLFGVYPGSNTTNTVSRFGPGRGKAFFDIGLFTTKQDNLPHFDPIDRGYLTLAEAESLYAVYMQHINPMITLLDPHLHTFEYVRSCSALLLSSTCWIAAKYRVEASQIAADLEMHIRSNLLPTILMEGFRNAEIPQALIILAAYHPQMNTLSEDKAWAYVGFAIRIASELDMNSRIAVRPANRQDDAGLARRLRNRERTWLNLWLFETSMSQHMGRRPTLANDPVVMGCAHWHLDKFALPQDKAVVAVVQLRLLMLRNVELFENFVDASVTHLPAERTGKQVELFRRICASDLDTWLATWTGPSHQLALQNTQQSSADPSTASETNDTGSKSQLWPHTDLPPTLSRIHRLKLYYWYARLLLDTIALKSSHLGLDVLRPIYKDAYACCMAYLGLFVATMVPNGLFWGHNSTVVTPAYCAIFALRIVGLISTSAGAASLQVKSQPKVKQEEELGIDIDAEYTFEMVEKVAKVCEEAGNATPHRRGAAGSYAFFLFTVLAKAKSAWNAKLAKKVAEEAAKDGAEVGVGAARNGKRDRDGNDVGERQGKFSKKGNATQQRDRENATTAKDSTSANGAQAHGVSGQTLPSSAQGNSTDTVDATSDDHHFLRQLMQFQAGPSGVQTAIVHNPSPANHAHPLPQTQTAFPVHYQGDLNSNVPHVHLDSMSSSSNATSTALGMGAALAGEVAGGAAAAADIDWDFGMLDGFLGESLFSDMSFISATAGGADGG
ncbi:uncharacterized protein UTRI_03192_B [Ustilago trichophora]|uniref:Zn(2)-C6 fungal-type domain-containing protein n=1 Tax=Ustilago trichophora TaxID=86804 RepID=A0A5C3E3W3_9BASI|nr:uncharacterized protein UTRI_03192_B [Ustilago trichophora]